MNTGSIICIAPTESSGLSKAQKAFNSSIKNIAKCRLTLQEWQEARDIIRSKQAQLLPPLEKALLEAQIEFAQALDNIYKKPPCTLSKPERKTVREVLENITNVIHGHGDERADALFETYGRKRFEQEARQLSGEVAFMAKSFLGVDLELEEDFFSAGATPEEMMSKLHEKMQQAEEQAKSQQPTRKKTAKQLAKESAQKQAQEQANQSIREVYRKLASALHPDRCVDEADREHKSQLMVRVNQAYEKDNLLELLSLQLEIEQIDPEHIQNLSEQRLKHFNAVLKEQLAELRAELSFLQNILHEQVDWPRRTIARYPRELIPAVGWQADGLQRMINEAQTDKAALSNPKTLKPWIQAIITQTQDELMAWV